jgi:hypothetical protein
LLADAANDTREDSSAGAAIPAETISDRRVILAIMLSSPYSARNLS